MKLTKRELDTLRLLALPRDVIAERLGISINTVATYICKLFEKYSPYDCREKVLIQAIKNGDIKIEDVVLE